MLKLMTDTRWVIASLAALCTTYFSAALAGDATSYEPMKPFERFAGKTWRGEGAGPDGSPIVDFAKWEFILEGRAFQWTHRLSDCSYGGRTIFFYDEAAEKYLFHYFTTAGFHTTGEATPTKNGFIVVEKVLGHPKYTEVRSAIVLEDDLVRIESRHKEKDGVLTDGEVMVFREIKDSLLLFDEGDALLGKRSTICDAHDRYEDDNK